MARKILTSSLSAAGSNFHYYQLPKGMLKVSVIQNAQGQSRIEAQELIIPDPAHRHYFQYHANAFSDDRIDIKFTPQGFLKRIDTTMEDKTAAVVEAVVDTVAEVVKGAVGLKSVGQDQTIFEETIDPFDETTMARINGVMKDLGVNFELSIQSLGGLETEEVFEKEVGENKFGIFCRSIEPYEFIVRLGKQERRQLVMLPHHKITHFVEIPYARFVANKFTMEFNDTGYPMSIHVEKPSQALAAIEMPLRIIKAILDIPAQIFKFRIDYNSQQLGSLQSEESLKAAIRQREENEKRLLEEAAKSRETQNQQARSIEELENEMNNLKGLVGNS